MLPSSVEREIFFSQAWRLAMVLENLQIADRGTVFSQRVLDFFLIFFFLEKFISMAKKSTSLRYTYLYHPLHENYPFSQLVVDLPACLPAC